MIRYFYLFLVSGIFTISSTAESSTVTTTDHINPAESAAPLSMDRGWTKIAGLLPKDSDAFYELEFWNSIKDSKDASDYEAYLKAYPNGRFAPLAESRAKRYKKSATTQSTKITQPILKIDKMDEQFKAKTTTNVREKPSSKSKKIGELGSKQTVQVTGRLLDRDWYQVRLSGGVTGYVYAPLLSKSTPEQKIKPKPQPKKESVADNLPKVIKTSSGNVIKDCDICPEMVPITPGQFIMGSNKGDLSEKPAHRVTLKQPFAIGKYEVTVAQWQECVKAGSCNYFPSTLGDSNSAPMRDVSWDDAQTYLKWLSTISGKEYRLPTESEWEYAARGGTTSKYWWGNKIDSGKANCKDCKNEDWNIDNPADVGSFDPNPLGIYDMSGNVWEWVADCWHKNYNGAPVDGRSWNKPDCRMRVIRGGSWRNDKSYVHSASRFKYDSYVRFISNGFRVARSIE